MSVLLPDIRNAVRAVILRDGALLMQKKWSESRGEWYTLPGGGQEVRESLTDTLMRECEEEIGAPVQVGDLIHVTDFYKPRETEIPSTRHLVEFLFTCKVPDDYRPMNGSHPDKHQIGVVWMPLDELDQHQLLPADLANCLADLSDDDRPCYLGTIV